MMVSESDGDNEVDAYGTAISTPRLNSQQINCFGDGESARTPDADTLDVTSTITWEVWGNFYITAPSTNEREIFTKSSNSWVLSLGGSGSAVGTMRIHTNDGTGSVARDFTVPNTFSCHTFVLESGVISQYTDGTYIGTGTSGVVKVPQAHTTVLTIGANAGYVWPFTGAIGSCKLYNTALDATDVLTNFNAQKALYGL
jgi:hypothetical protein